MPAGAPPYAGYTRSLATVGERTLASMIHILPKLPPPPPEVTRTECRPLSGHFLNRAALRKRVTLP